MAQRSAEQHGQQLGRDAAAVVLHGKDGVFAILMHRECNMGGVFAVSNGVFKQIGHDLLNEDRIHRHDEQLIRHSHRYLDAGIVLAEFAGDLAEHLLGGLRLLGDPGVLAHAGDGQQVFHHADQPLRVIAHILEQLMLLFERQVGRFQNGRG